MNLLTRHPARVYSLIAAGLTVAARYGVDLPQEDILTWAAGAILLLTGEAVQRTENRKTETALREPTPVDPADDGFVDLEDVEE